MIIIAKSVVIMYNGHIMLDCKLYNIISEYSSNTTRFHMPGHNGAAHTEINLAYDITELPFSDNMLYPTGVILGAEQDIACAYNMRHALMFTQGATSVILTALHATKVIGKAVAVDKIAHRSIYAAAELLSLDIIVYDNASLSSLDMNNIGVILITSPNYYGFTTDFRQIVDIAKSHGICVILDQSHGSHYAFSPLLPKVDYSGIDVIINSLHKTLPCMTGAAVALTNCQEMYNKLYYSRTLVHSTSPSYMVMATIDKARAIMQVEGAALYNDVIDTIRHIKLDSNYYHIVSNDDPTRLVVATESSDIVAASMAEAGIYPELTSSLHIVFIVTPYNASKLGSLVHLLGNITDKLKPLNIATNYNIIPEIEALTCCNIIATAHNSELVNLQDAIGRTAAAAIGLYPPGCPIIRPGELITTDMVDYVNTNIDRIFGLLRGMVKVIKMQGDNI